MSRPDRAPSPPEILEQLDRILSSELFAASQRMREFLRYLITETLGEGRPRLKELAIGMAVFGRDESFDPRIDAVVRVEAGRLRAKLREYYSDVGAADPIHITIPKGGYSPAFAFLSKSSTRTRRSSFDLESRRGLTTATLFLSLVVLIAVAMLIVRNSHMPDSIIGELPFSIAVLPLGDWTRKPDDYFSEAMTDALIAELSERQELRVTSLSSVMNYRNSQLQPSQIAEQLGVAYIIEGTVFRESGRVRITANLIHADSNRNLWSKTFNRSMTNVLMLQEEVASEIAGQLVGELVPSAAVGPSEINPLAYEAFLKGTYWRNRLTAEGFNRGLLFFHQAIELQPDYAEAYAAMASCHCRLAGHGIEVVRPDLALVEATRLAARALELNATLAEPNAVLGIIKFKFEWDAAAATQYLERALERNPSLFEAHLWLSQVAEGTGRQELAVEHARRAQRVNPLSQAATLNLGWQLYQAGLATEAERQFDSLLEFEPEFWGGHWGKGHSYRERGMYEEAIAEFSRAVELEGGHALPLASLGYTYAIAGQRDQALAVIERLESIAREMYVSPVHVAQVYVGLSDPDSAFEWLEKGLQLRARSMAWLAVRREFQSLHADPRYPALVAAIGITGDYADGGTSGDTKPGRFD